MAIGLGIVVLVAGIGLSLWLAYSALTQIKQLRTELDETQRQLNDLRGAVETAAATPPPPPLPRSRSAGLQDLREQLRASHREEAESDE